MLINELKAKVKKHFREMQKFEKKLIVFVAQKTNKTFEWNVYQMNETSNCLENVFKSMI